ncbi:MAG: disulfide bond formation protein B [Pseudomonadota bacterium]
MSRAQIIGLAALGSLLVLGSAYGFQYIGGYLPCAMCLWQRWPHVIAIALGAVGLALPHIALAAAGALAMAANTGLAVFHTGVERGWWEGPSTCAGSAAQDLSVMTGADLLDFSTGPQIVLCDEAALHILGLSMASWNAVACAALALLWLTAIRRPAPRHS